ncbi:Metallo-dependent phosphatase [Mollisia scopiformis]|uniref:Metallo-dependent phosphatase n=1 Tax=Mollisia scopiformis TaxID=149040 RepID=A0A132BCP1_MOLSC|nr:Metallo-dependent phosphatase [Mollisia scopiformis]KUJ10148.1 Metallo-dependent phosphatase [Mollisia scopiformis]
MTTTVSTKFLIISDTHSFEFGDAEKVNGPFRLPIPKVDVVLHCGDLTSVGGPSAYKGVLKMLGAIDAELKLVIAGNHDLDLDRKYFDSHLDEDDDPEQHNKSVEIMTGALAKEAGVTYLVEGLSTFTLKNGVKFTIYASPYQPEFYDWAFPYERNEDRFNPPQNIVPGVKCITENPIPDFPGIDILMTHGPPENILDETNKGTHVGCEALMTAVSRARPLLYCFGHIHEGYGAATIAWNEDKTKMGAEAIRSQGHLSNAYSESLNWSPKFGKETLMVNAAIKDVRYKPTNAPWIVQLDLPRGD